MYKLKHISIYVYMDQTCFEYSHFGSPKLIHDWLVMRQTGVLSKPRRFSNIGHEDTSGQPQSFN